MPQRGVNRLMPHPVLQRHEYKKPNTKHR
jgi:hypothetical protein